MRFFTAPVRPKICTDWRQIFKKRQRKIENNFLLILPSKHVGTAITTLFRKFASIFYYEDTNASFTERVKFLFFSAAEGMVMLER
jgi:hypothetical protein